MPYRRLPNTDTARLKALKTAYGKAKDLPPFKLAFSQSSFQKIQSFLPLFEKNLTESRFSFTNQVKRSKDYQNQLKRIRMYISHFLQVLNMSIQRGELPAIARTFYGLSENDKKIPSLNSEESILLWGEKLINGDIERIRKGGSHISNPSIAMVRIRFENFKDAYHSQKTLQKSNTRSVHNLSEMRKTADSIIAMVWNEIEESFKNMTEDVRREKAQEYGIVYVYRKNEINRLSIPVMAEMLRF